MEIGGVVFILLGTPSKVMNATRHNFRISMSLVSLTLMIVFIANGLGLIPDEDESLIRERVALSESLAIQLSAAVQAGSLNIIPDTAKSVVERNPRIHSLLLRKLDGTVIASAGDYGHPDNGLDSTVNNMKVPIFKDNQGWGVLEVGFVAVKKGFFGELIGSTFFQLCAFFALFGFVFYFFLVRKVLLHLDPNKVIPARVKKALDAVSDGIVFIDKDERILLSNTAFKNKLTSHADDLLGKKLSGLTWFESGGSKETVKDYPWIDTLIHNTNRKQISLKLQSRKSGPLTLIVSSTPIQDTEGDVKGALVSFSDVTELEKVSGELESMTQFLRHELNNALVGAAGMVALLGKSEHLTEEDKYLVNRTQRLHQVIRYLLDSVKEARSIEASFANEEPKPLRLDTLIADITSNYSSIYEDHDFVFKTDGNEITVLGLEERLIQMLDKLASNAVEHSEKNTAITIECTQEKDHGIIRVINQGDPLPENKGEIFNLFASFKNKDTEKQNQGIGLYVVKFIAEAYGGTVEARDRKDVTGAEFIIRLPTV